MASGETIDDVIRRIINILDAASVPYMLTGSFASSLHGMPRATQDIDLVIAPNPATLEALLKSFPEDRYYVSREAAFDAYQRASLFNVIDFASGLTIMQCLPDEEFSLLSHEHDYRIVHNYGPVGLDRLTDSLHS
jgi:hypothetical protein